jgi:4-hydroxy-3-methylbut-2-enyl diphosphate reductase
MYVITAAALGMCFGVRDALAITRQLDRPADITINGQLVHNPLVNNHLVERGFTLAHEAADEIPATPAVLITAHGISNRQRSALESAGKSLIDTTCPLVRKAHAAAMKLQSLGFHVLVIGQKNHVEVRGLTGDLDAFDVLESPADVRLFPHAKLGIIAQTTTIQRDAQQIVDAVRAANPQAHVRFLNTICQPTRDRQRALDDLLQQVDILVVVGGRNSNNTRRLVQRAHERSIPAIHVEHAGQLDPDAFHPEQVVGLTAGTSTLPETIAAVKARLEEFHRDHSAAEAVATRGDDAAM